MTKVVRILQVAGILVVLGPCGGGGGGEGLDAAELEERLTERSSAILDATCEEESGGNFSCRATYVGQVPGVAPLQRLPAEITVTKATSDAPEVTVLLDGKLVDFFVLD